MHRVSLPRLKGGQRPGSTQPHDIFCNDCSQVTATRRSYARFRIRSLQSGSLRSDLLAQHRQCRQNLVPAAPVPVRAETEVPPLSGGGSGAMRHSMKHLPEPQRALSDCRSETTVVKTCDLLSLFPIVKIGINPPSRPVKCPVMRGGSVPVASGRAALSPTRQALCREDERAAAVLRAGFVTRAVQFPDGKRARVRSSMLSHSGAPGVVRLCKTGQPGRPASIAAGTSTSRPDRTS